MSNYILGKLIEITLKWVRIDYGIELVSEEEEEANFFDDKTGKAYLCAGSWRGLYYIGFEDGIKGKESRIGSDYKYKPGDYMNLDVSYGEGYRAGSKIRSKAPFKWFKTKERDSDER